MRILMTLHSKISWWLRNKLGFTKKHLQLLTTAVCKSKTGVSPKFINDIFLFAETNYNLRNNYTLKRKRDRTVYHGSESLSYLTAILWDLLPKYIKNSVSLKKFKTKINTWAADRCPCRISKKCVGRERI